MANHPNRNWKRRWTLDEASMEARHDSGYIAKLVPDHAQGWTIISPNEAETLQALAVTGDARPHDGLMKLTQQAEKLFKSSIARRNRMP